MSLNHLLENAINQLHSYQIQASFVPLPRVSIALTPEKLRAIFGEDLRVSPAKDAL